MVVVISPIAVELVAVWGRCLFVVVVAVVTALVVAVAFAVVGPPVFAVPSSADIVAVGTVGAVPV